MTFAEGVDQALAVLQRRGRVPYRMLQRHVPLDDAALADLQDELLSGQRLAGEEEGRVRGWRGAPTSAAPSTSGRAPAPDGSQAREPRAYTPPYLADKIRTTRLTLEGERKHITVRFADLTGSTALSRALAPEQARAILAPALHAMMEAVHRYEGTVSQVRGDGLRALCGAPLAHAAHTARACYAALAMQDALRRSAEAVRRTHGLTGQRRVGLPAGDVVVRAIGHDLLMDYSAVGLPPVLAARMAQLARPGPADR